MVDDRDTGHTVLRTKGEVLTLLHTHTNNANSFRHLKIN